MAPAFASWKSLSSRWPPSSSRAEYISVPDDDNEKGEAVVDASTTVPLPLRLRLHQRLLQQRQRHRHHHLPTLWQLLTLISLIALFVMSTLYIRLVSSLAPPPRLSCGHTFAEATAANCEFDQLVKAWLPPACPRYGLEEYLEAGYTSTSLNKSLDASGDGQWPYWHDREKTQPMTIQGLSGMAADWEVGEKYWTTGREHVTHCTWMLIRMAYVYNTPGQRRDLLVSNFPHAKHCALFMLDRALEGPDVDAVRTIGNVVFGSC